MIEQEDIARIKGAVRDEIAEARADLREARADIAATVERMERVGPTIEPSTKLGRATLYAGVAVVLGFAVFGLLHAIGVLS